MEPIPNIRVMAGGNVLMYQMWRARDHEACDREI